ncbi:hypothetical protein [Enterocloster sp.]|jgi:hypothetical protein|uniref:hypothetical protein n=1 Tax=Enterocloster sp. TaxID=2719315 RepID=UPI003996864F
MKKGASLQKNVVWYPKDLWPNKAGGLLASGRSGGRQNSEPCKERIFMITSVDRYPDCRPEKQAAKGNRRMDENFEGNICKHYHRYFS